MCVRADQIDTYRVPVRLHSSRHELVSRAGLVNFDGHGCRAVGTPAVTNNNG
jgi:hypothetical protein